MVGATSRLEIVPRRTPDFMPLPQAMKICLHLRIAIQVSVRASVGFSFSVRHATGEDVPWLGGDEQVRCLVALPR
jgi:hypothetical protein